MTGGIIRVVLIDDHTVLREGLKLLLSLEADLEVVGDASNGEEGLLTVERVRPQVVVTDVGLPDIDGIEVTHRLRERFPEVRVLVLTVHDEDTYVFTLMQAGASGYLVKNAAANDLVRAIRTVAAGRPWLQPQIAQRLVRAGETDVPIERQPASPVQGVPSADLIEPLTPRELEVLRLLAGAASNREIADRLEISLRTAETHLTNVYGKLGVRGRTEAMLWAIREGLVAE